MNRRVVILTPEPPYPLQSGGAYRTASLVHYFARIADVDLILLSESGQPALLPRGLVRSQQVIPLRRHSRSTAARYWRNARRAIRGVPPLIDRLGGLHAEVASALAGKHYDIGLVEHFWCASYVAQLSQCCETSVLNLHNIESTLHARCAETDSLLQAAGHRRFAAAALERERELLPRFDLVLAASASDTAAAQAIAPAARLVEYPNALPTVALPSIEEDPNLVVFSGNFEYHPNIDAVRFLAQDLWPHVRQKLPRARMRLVGRGDAFVRHLIPAGSGIEMTGPVENAFAEIARSALVLAPLRAGSGTRIKILEAWAGARPVVATPLAAEGLDAREGENIVLADTPEQLANLVTDLLNSPAERRRVGLSGRFTYDKLYTWTAAWHTMDRHLQALHLSDGGYTG